MVSLVSSLNMAAFVIALIFFSGLTSSFCDVAPRMRPSSISGGTDFVSENIYHLSLNHNGVHLCSATLLKTPYDKLVAITAASCLRSSEAKEYTITFGKARAGKDGDEYCILTKLKLYEDFDKQTLDNDLALLFSDDITSTGGCDLFMNRTLGVVLSNRTTSMLHVKVSGWDVNTDTLKIIQDEICAKPEFCNEILFDDLNITIGSTMLCYGISNRFNDPGYCRAERGSPVVAIVPETPPVLVAVTSWTLDEDFDDDTIYPCVGTGVFDDSIKKWIESEVEEFAIR